MKVKKYIIEGIEVECRISDSMDDVGVEKAGKPQRKDQQQVFCLYQVGELKCWYRCVATNEMVKNDPEAFDLYMDHLLKREIKNRLSNLASY